MRRAALFLMTAGIVPTAACDQPTDYTAAPEPTTPVFTVHVPGWAPAVKLDAVGASLLNTPALEGCPNESPDGRRLFFASDRDGSIDIWYSERDANGVWGNPIKLPAPVNSSANDFCPTALPGGGLLFVSTRTDLPNCGAGTADIYETAPDHAGGWVTPVNLGCVINSGGNEFSPSLVSAGGGMLFFSSDRSGLHSIYVSLRTAAGSWSTPAAVPELNLGFASFRPNVSADGREIVFDSNRDGVSSDVWYSRRDTPHALWSPPTNAGSGVNSTAAESRASFSRDGRRLYFGSTRAGSSDIYVSQRQ